MDPTADRVTDWKVAAPKWLLLAMLCGSWIVGGFFGSVAWGEFRWRWEEQERKAGDPKWEKIGLLAYEQGRTNMIVTQHEGRIKQLEDADLKTQMVKLSNQIERLNDRLAAKGF